MRLRLSVIDQIANCKYKYIAKCGFSITGTIWYVAAKPGQTLSLTETLFPGSNSGVPQNKLVNMTFDCTTKQLDVHIEIIAGVEVIPQILSFSNLILSLRVTLGIPPHFHIIILSANAQLFSMNTFVAVEYKLDSKKIAIKGVPTDTTSLNMQKALQAVSGASLKVPSSMSMISQVKFLGQVENGVTTIAIKGMSGESAVTVLLQKSSSTKNAALIADIHNFNLASFVKTALNIDITGIPLFGTLTMSRVGFSAATGKITSSLLPQIYMPGSPLETFGNTLPSGVSAYFTVNIAGVSVNATFSAHKFAFKVPKTPPLSVKQLLDQIPKLSSPNSLPKIVTDILNSKLSGFIYDPESKFLKFGLMIPELTIVPNILKLTNVNFILSAMIGQNPSIQTLKFSGTWKFNTVHLTTSIDYDGQKKFFQVKATPESSGTPLSIAALVKNVAGVGGKLPSVLTSLTLNSVVGHVYNNGKYFLVMSGTVSGGKLYLLFYKDAEGVKVGIAASLQSFELSTLVQSTTGVDISSVPYFGSLVVPAMAISITSGVIKSPVLPHLFGEGSPLLVYGDTLPAGVTSQFDLDIGNVKGAAAKFFNGVLSFQIPKSFNFSVLTLASQIPGISNTMQTLPAQIRNILGATVTSFSFNSTSKDLSIAASLSRLTLVSGFLSISNVSLSYDGTLGKTLSTRMLIFSGTWEISEYAIFTSVIYNGATKELTITSQSSEGKDLSISNVLESLAGTTVPLPPVMSSFTFTGITGKTANGTTVIVLNGRVEGGKISAVFQKNHSGLAGAVVVDISNFKLAKLVKSATGTNISAIPFFGSLEIPELRFAASTNNITTPILGELAGTSSALEWFKMGILKGVSGRFVIQIGNVSRVAVNLVHSRLKFKVPARSSLSLGTVLSTMPKVKGIVSSLPSQLRSVLNAKVATFSYDPSSKELHFIGSLNSTVEIIPHFLSLSSLKISLVLVLGQSKHIKTFEFRGDWMLKNLLIHTGVSYNRKENRLNITGELNPTSGGINIQELITALSGKSLSIPSVLSSVKLSKLSGNKIGNVTCIALSGSVGNGHIFLIYQKSPSGSAVAVAADIPKFKFSTLVSSATGIDISNIPFFGQLVISHIGFTIASKHINNPLLTTIFPPNSFLDKVGESISKGITASFTVDIADVKGIVADFAKGELNLHVPKTIDLSLINILSVTDLKSVIDSLPRTIRDIGSTKLHKLYFVPSTKELQLTGSLESLTIIPNFLTLQNITFDFAGTIGNDSQVKFAKLKGDWIFNTLAFTTEVFYENKLLLIKGSPSQNKSLNVKNIIEGLKGRNLNIPSALNALMFTQVIGKIQDCTFSIVLLGEIGTKADVAIVYKRSKNNKIISFAADIQKFQLSELVKAGTGIDISSVPFFGKLTIPALSFIVSSKQFSTASLPNLNVAGVHVPKQLLLASVPAGVKGRFLADIGSARGVISDFSNKILKIKVPSSVSLSLKNLFSVAPEIQSTFDFLPSRVKEILNAKIRKLTFNPVSKNLFISLSLDTLTLVPNSMSIKDLNISLDTSLASTTDQLPVQDMQMTDLQTYRDLIAQDQAISVNTLDISALWVIRGIKVKISLKYDKQQKLFKIHGNGNSNDSISIADIIKGFSGSSLPVPSILSSIKLSKVIAISSDNVTTIILTAAAGTANVYLVFQKTQSSSVMAIAAEMHAVKVVDLIKTATGLNLGGVPFIRSIVVSSMAFSASTNPINTPLLATTFNPDGPLHTYGTTLPKGVTAHFEIQIAGKTCVAVSYQNKTLTFDIPSKVNLSFSELLSEIQSLNAVIKSLPSPISDLLSSRLIAMEFDATTKTLSVAASLDKLTIIPKVMEVNNIEVQFVAILSSINGSLQSLDFSADWVLRNVHIRVKVSYDKESKRLVFAAIPKQALSIQTFINRLTGTHIPPSVINSVKLVKIVGRKESCEFTIIFSGTIPNKAGVHVIYQNTGNTSNIAIAAGINSFKFAELIQSAVKIDITSVPFFGTFSVPSLALTISNRQMKTDLLGDVLAANSPLIKYGDNIPAGFTAKFDVPLIKQEIKRDLQNDVLAANSPFIKYASSFRDGPMAKFDSKIGRVKGILGSYSNKILSFTVPPSVDASLGSLISVIPGLNVKAIPFFGNILKIRVKNFTFDVSKKEMSIELFLKKITFLENLLSIRDIQLNITTILSTSRALSAEASGTIVLGKTNYRVNFRRDKTTGNYTLTVETKKFPIFGLITAIGAKFLPGDLPPFLEKIFQFDILNAKVVYPIGVKPQQIQISGTPKLFGLKLGKMTAVAFKHGGKMRLIQKISLGSLNIAYLINKLVGVSLHKLKILNQAVPIDIVMSPTTIKGVSLSVPGFRDFSPNRGISIKASLGWPSDCSTDQFCNAANTLLKGFKLSLETTITNSRSFTMTAAVGHLKLGGGVVLLQAGLKINGGTELSVGIVGSIELKKPAITLNVEIKLTEGGVKLEGSMSGCWHNAFGSSYLTICNLFLSIAIFPTLTGLEFGGRIEVGKQSCGHVLTAEGYVGFNMLNPKEDYFYADVGPVTFQKFFDAFCINVKLPKPLGDSGFPNGFKTSFSILGKELPHAGITIPPGYRFRGTLNFLGVEAYADIYLQPPTKLTANISLSPVTIGGVLKMYKSSTDRKAGPYLRADITTTKAPIIEASCFIEVFGISKETKLLISNSKYLFEFRGKYLKLFETQFTISASYAKSISSASFLVEGRFKNDLFDKITQSVRGGVKKSAHKAKHQIRKAESRIKEEAAKLDHANTELKSAKRKVNDANNNFNAASNKLSKAQGHDVCHHKSCRLGTVYSYILHMCISELIPPANIQQYNHVLLIYIL